MGNAAAIFGKPEEDPYWDLDDWDDDELLRGQRKNKNGKFANKPVRYVPTKVHQELVKRQMRLAKHHLNAHLMMASRMLIDIIRSPTTDDGDRLKAIAMLFDRTMGKAPEKVEVTSDAPWVLALQNMTVVGNDDQLPNPLADSISNTDVIDVQSQEDDDPWM